MLPIDVVRKIFESVETGDMESVGIYLAESLAVTGMVPDTIGKKQFLAIMEGLVTAVPDWSFNTRQMYERGNIVRAVVRITGKNTGVLTMPAVGITAHQPTWKAIVLPEERVEFSARMNKVYTIKYDRTPGGWLNGVLQQVGASLREPVPA